jgi:hypothetical protein
MYHFTRFFFLVGFIACCGWMSFATYKGLPQRDMASVAYEFTDKVELSPKFHYSAAYKL